MLPEGIMFRMLAGTQLPAPSTMLVAAAENPSGRMSA